MHHPSIGLCLLVAALGSGCRDEAGTGTGPTHPAGGADAGRDTEQTPDIGDCIQSNSGVEICNGLDDDCNGAIDDVAPDLVQLQRDVLHCGACGHRCDAPNSSPRCEGGVCGFVCNSGWNDVDGDPENGCEIQCVPTNGGVEICDHVDNDCDTETDEDFDLDFDPANCGACGRVCALPGVAEHRCEVGDCLKVRCAPGFSDLNGELADGCEYPCLPTAEDLEFCNGFDDDCDGLLDEDDPDLAAPAFACAQFGVCAGTQPVCEDGDWRCHYPEPPLRSPGKEVLCDNRDNDCDGQIDEDFPGKGEPCTRGHGVCAGAGEWECSPDERSLRCTALERPERAAVEVCNGFDDDCDGRIDNDITDLEWVQIGDSRVFRYEASRPGASVDHAGNLGGGACSKRGVLPWSDVTWEEARSACTAVGGGAGWRLCSVDEWRLACGGPARMRFPYSNDFDPDACNGAQHGERAALPSGALEATCENRSYGTVDMSGNLKEWTATEAAEGEEVHFLLGGAYDNRLEESLSCRGLAIPRQDSFHYPNLGFRCCMGGVL